MLKKVGGPRKPQLEIHHPAILPSKWHPGETTCPPPDGAEGFESSGKTQCDNGHIAHHPIAGATGVYRIALVSLKGIQVWLDECHPHPEYLPA